MPALRRRLVLFLTALVLVLTPLQPTSAATTLSWRHLDTTLTSLAGDSNLLVAEFRGNGCATIHARAADRTLAIASTFKLYVLGELGRQVLAGGAAWDDQIVLRADLRSMPSGDYAWVAAGTRVTVRHLAEAMIWHSDNTATDHLIDYLGRDEVQRAFAAFGHSDPARNTPLLYTRELFAIKMTRDASWMADYAAADDDTQLTMLSDEIDPLRLDPDGGWGAWNGPTAIEDIEWFASADDLCRATAAIWTLGAQPGLTPLRTILAGNRGAVGNLPAFPQAGYKGGYEAGVVNLTYVLEREDGRVFFVSAGYNSTAWVIDAGIAASYLTPVFACLGEDACASADL